MDISTIIGFLAPLIVIGLTQILKKWIQSKWAPLIVFILGGISMLIGVGPRPGEGFVDSTINIAWVSGGAALLYDMFKKIKIKRTRIFIFTCFIAASFLVSCATFESNTYKTMYALGLGYDTAMKSANELYKQGKLSQEQVFKIIDLANLYYAAYQEACVAFEIYNKTKSAADKDKLITLLKVALEKHVEIIAFTDRLKK
jgi:hypothetical protein